MLNSALVTVLMPTYNCAAYISTAIDSALAQTYPAVEIIVIDDGSTDNTQAILINYQDKIQIITQTNKGVAAARNAGLALARGKYIATLDADDSWLPERLEQAVKYLEGSQNDIVLTNFYLIDEIGQPIKIYFNPRFSLPKNQYKTLLHSPLPFVMMVTKAELVKDLGYDEAVHFAEDYDLYLRALKMGARLGYIQEPLAAYRIRANSLSHSHNKDYKSIIRRIFNKHRPVLGCYKTLLFYHYHLGLYRWFLFDSALKSKRIKFIIEQGLIALLSPWFAIVALRTLWRRVSQRNYVR